MYLPSFPPFHSFVATIKDHSVSFTGTALSWFGVIIANETVLDIWLKRGSWIFAIAASLVAIWAALRKDRRESRDK